MRLRVATFNVENLDDGPDVSPLPADRIAIMRPQLERVHADVLCLQEVHSQGATGSRSLRALDELLLGTRYAGYHRAVTKTTTDEFYDKRNLVTLSRFPIRHVENIRGSDGPRPSYRMATASPPDAAADPLEWERPLLYVTLELPEGRLLHLVNLHLKSKLPTTVPGGKLDSFTWRTASSWAEGSFVSAMKRLGQALQVRLLVDRLFDTHGNDLLAAVCGDFNAELDDVPVLAVRGPVEETGNPAHAPRVFVPCELQIAESRRFSLLHLGHGYMLDHILVSRRFFGYFEEAEVHNEVLPDESGAFRVDKKFPESDHAPVVAQFELR